MYADKKTKAIENTVAITSKRRELQKKYNLEHGIIPKTTKRSAIEELSQTFGEELPSPQELPKNTHLTKKEIDQKIKEYESCMKKAAKELRFEEAGQFRDLLRHYQQLQLLEENL